MTKISFIFFNVTTRKFSIMYIYGFHSISMRQCWPTHSYTILYYLLLSLVAKPFIANSCILYRTVSRCECTVSVNDAVTNVERKKGEVEMSLKLSVIKSQSSQASWLFSSIYVALWCYLLYSMLPHF